MTKSKPSSNTSSSSRADQVDKNKQALISSLRKDVETLSYEESYKALDLILVELQNDNIPIEELQRSYLQGKIYLEHCENILKETEEEVLSLCTETFELKPYSSRA